MPRAASRDGCARCSSAATPVPGSTAPCRGVALAEEPRPLGASPGAGVSCCCSGEACPVAEAARVDALARSASARQCGPCGSASMRSRAACEHSPWAPPAPMRGQGSASLTAWWAVAAPAGHPMASHASSRAPWRVRRRVRGPRTHGPCAAAHGPRRCPRPLRRQRPWIGDA